MVPLLAINVRSLGPSVATDLLIALTEWAGIGPGRSLWVSRTKGPAHRRGFLDGQRHQCDLGPSSSSLSLYSMGLLGAFCLSQIKRFVACSSECVLRAHVVASVVNAALWRILDPTRGLVGAGFIGIPLDGFLRERASRAAFGRFRQYLGLVGLVLLLFSTALQSVDHEFQ